MTRSPRKWYANTVIRVPALPVIVVGVAAHLITGAKLGLGVALVGLLAHLVAALAGRRWLARRDRAADQRPDRAANSANSAGHTRIPG